MSDERLEQLGLPRRAFLAKAAAAFVAPVVVSFGLKGVAEAEASPEHRHPNQTCGNQTLPNQTAPNQTVGNQTLPNQTVGNQTLPNQTVGNQTFPNQTHHHHHHHRDDDDDRWAWWRDEGDDN